MTRMTFKISNITSDFIYYLLISALDKNLQVDENNFCADTHKQLFQIVHIFFDYSVKKILRLYKKCPLTLLWMGGGGFHHSLYFWSLEPSRVVLGTPNFGTIPN